MKTKHPRTAEADESSNSELQHFQNASAITPADSCSPFPGESIGGAVALQNAIGKTITSSDLPRLAYSVAEAAQMLGVCERTIRRLVARGLLRPSRALRHLLIPKKEIERFLEETLSQ